MSEPSCMTCAGRYTTFPTPEKCPDCGVPWPRFKDLYPAPDRDEGDDVLPPKGIR